MISGIQYGNGFMDQKNSMHTLHTQTIEMLAPINHLGHTLVFVEINGEVSDGEIVYTCQECSLYCFIETELYEDATFDFSIKMDEDMPCKDYQKAKNKIIATHNFERDSSPYGFHCTKCYMECGSIKNDTPLTPDILWRPLWASTSLITCSEVKLHNIML